jgi:hypothetical protein
VGSWVVSCSSSSPSLPVLAAGCNSRILDSRTLSRRRGRPPSRSLCYLSGVQTHRHCLYTEVLLVNLPLGGRPVLVAKPKREGGNRG